METKVKYNNTFSMPANNNNNNKSLAASNHNNKATQLLNIL